MNVYLRAARDAVATVGAAYIPFSLVRVIAYPEFDIYFVGRVEEFLGVIGVGLFAVLAFNYSFAASREKGRGRFAGSVANSGSEKGNVLFLILIAVALFAALSYAVTSSSRGGGTIQKEQAQLDQAVMDNFMSAINVGKMRLEMAGCSSIDYTAPADQAASGSKACHLFHPDGGGVAWQDLGVDSCKIETGKSLSELAVGESGCGVIYAGSSGGKRIYIKPSDQGTSLWSSVSSVTGATSTSGFENTSTLLSRTDGTYHAAATCRALGSSWFLPSMDELRAIYSNRAVGELVGKFTSTWYLSSNEATSSVYTAKNLANGSEGSCCFKTSTASKLLCARND